LNRPAGFFQFSPMSEIALLSLVPRARPLTPYNNSTSPKCNHDSFSWSVLFLFLKPIPFRLVQPSFGLLPGRLCPEIAFGESHLVPPKTFSHFRVQCAIDPPLLVVKVVFAAAPCIPTRHNFGSHSSSSCLFSTVSVTTFESSTVPHRLLARVIVFTCTRRSAYHGWTTSFLFLVIPFTFLTPSCLGIILHLTSLRWQPFTISLPALHTPSLLIWF